MNRRPSRSGTLKSSYRPKRPRPSHRAKQSIWPKISLLTSIVALTLGGGGFAANTYMSKERPDQFGCYSRPGQNQVAIWLDASLIHQSVAQIRDYERGFEQAYDQAPANAQIMIFSTARDIAGTLIEPIFTICKPAATISELDTLGLPSKTAPMLVREAIEARDRYVSAMGDAIAVSQDPTLQAGDSPILEQLRSLSWHTEFQGRNRSLTIITDGIQNSEVAQFCAVAGHMPSFATFSGRPHYAELEPEPFTGMAVTVLLIESIQLPAPGLLHCSTTEMRTWWRDYFEGNGAESVHLTPVRRWDGS